MNRQKQKLSLISWNEYEPISLHPHMGSSPILEVVA